MGSVANQQRPLLLRSASICKWFSVHMGFGSCGGVHLQESAEGLESIWVTGPAAVFVLGVRGSPKGGTCRSADQRETGATLPPQLKKGHLCQSFSLVVASCPLKAQQALSSQGKPAYFQEEEEEGIHSPALLPEAQN
ncbi:unnamed protein product [Nyctereutes procyonoides]|uniref:(raccoon dog) hypothetical protein n=1 Tax=Nyctereutes procyonoides TaxID=34880 RepID=A0A811YUR5_NYCPR|nr:unnamed protein product [Nyctereutes procyonoides]